MSSKLNNEDGATTTVYQDDVLVAPTDNRTPDTQDGVMKSYRVTLRAQVLVEIDVEAENERKASGKAFEWSGSGNRGTTTVGCFGWTDEDDNDHYQHEDSYLDWEIVEEVEMSEILRVVELDNSEST